VNFEIEPNTILYVRHGSRAYGTNLPDSDHDFRLVGMMSPYRIPAPNDMRQPDELPVGPRHASQCILEAAAEWSAPGGRPRFLVPTHIFVPWALWLVLSREFLGGPRVAGERPDVFSPPFTLHLPFGSVEVWPCGVPEILVFRKE
jgi:hypothetical protein